MRRAYPVRKLRIALGVAFFVLLTHQALTTPLANAAVLQNRSLLLSSNDTSATNVTYEVSFTYPSISSIGSVKIQFCQESPLLEDVCVGTARPSFAAASLSAQTGETGYSIHPSSTSNEIILTRTPTVTGTTASSYIFTNVTNQSVAGTGYVRLSTYPTTDATGSEVDKGGIAYVMSEQLQLTTEVPPYLEFCVGEIITGLDCSGVSGALANFGSVTSQNTAVAASQFAVATNGDNGYSVSVSGATMTSGNNVITSMQNPGVSIVGQNQFGINLRGNTSPEVGSDVVGSGVGVVAARYDTPNQFTYTSNEQIAYALDESSYNKYTVSYILNVSDAQPAGYYATTLSYLCLANF